MTCFDKKFLLGVALSMLTGCSTTPNSGPNSKAVEANAAVSVSQSKGNKKHVVGIDYALIDVNSVVLGYVAEATSPSLNGSFAGGRGAAPTLPLGVGDVVQISIFESQAGGLFIPADAGSRPGNYVSLPQQTIPRGGSINVPYAGDVPAVGRTTDGIARDIEDRLANRAIEPQVLVTKVSSRSAEVAVLGDVNRPAKIELTDAGERVLDVISEAGGLSAPGEETYITLQRRGRSATILYQHLANTPRENIYVVPGDTILVDRERRTYLAFGASGLNGRFDFEESDLTLGEALGKAGGLLDGRADPSQVLLYRVVKKDLLSKLGADTSKFASNEVPVIFRANLKDPSAFFAVQKFPMQDKDILFVTNSKSVELLKVLNIINSVTASVSGVASDTVSTKDSVRSF